MKNRKDNTLEPNGALERNLERLKLSFIKKNYQNLSEMAAKKQWSHLDFLTNLMEGEANTKWDNFINRRVKAAKFPVIKTMDNFQWNFPKKINREQVQNFFRLQFIKEKANIILLGGVGLGKTHIACSLGYEACLNGHSVLYVNTINAINSLSAAKNSGTLHLEIKKFCKPSVLILDELGYLPIDKLGADLLFQIISHRYEQGSTIITANRAYEDWSEIFNNDATVTSAMLDRILHHSDTSVIEGDSFRMKDKIKK